MFKLYSYTIFVQFFYFDDGKKILKNRGKEIKSWNLLHSLPLHVLIDNWKQFEELLMIFENIVNYWNTKNVVIFYFFAISPILNDTKWKLNIFLICLKIIHCICICKDVLKLQMIWIRVTFFWYTSVTFTKDFRQKWHW